MTWVQVKVGVRYVVVMAKVSYVNEGPHEYRSTRVRGYTAVKALASFGWFLF